LISYFLTLGWLVGILSPVARESEKGRFAVSECYLYNIERISYTKALSLQLDLHARCVSGELPGVLLLLEHDPVITMGVKTADGNVLASPEVLDREGVELVRTDRGGDVTYHGPGQLVGYPIFRLREMWLDLRTYLDTLQQSIIDAIADFGLAGRRHGLAGVWVGDRKVCSIGIAVRKWVTYHGFALNVDPNMRHFAFINPCGLASQQITSLKELLGAAPDMADVRQACARGFERNFGISFAPWPGGRL
jgi:lipoate-protein ligase B